MPYMPMNGRNNITQALMNVRTPSRQMPQMPPQAQVPGGFPPIPPGGPGSYPPPPTGPQYGTTGGTAGPMPTAPLPPGGGTGTAGPMPTLPPQANPMAAARSMPQLPAQASPTAPAYGLRR